MPTVIDSLVLEFGLDPSKFTRGQKDAIGSLKELENRSVATGKTVEAQSAKTARFFSDFKRQVLEIGAVFLGGRGIQEFIGYVTTLDASTGRLSKTLNVSASELSAWQGAAQQVGGSAESINGSLQGLSGEMQRLTLTGQAAFLPLFNRLGISIFNANHQLKTAGDLLLELSTAMEGMDPARAAAMLSMVPGMNQDTINLLLKGRAAVEGYLRAAREAGTTTKESAAAAEEYQEKLRLLEQSATAAGRSIFTILAPALTSTLDGIRKLITAMRTGKVEGGGSLEGAGARAQGIPEYQGGFGYNLVRGIMGPKTAEELYGPGGSAGKGDKITTPGPRGSSVGAIPQKEGAGSASPQTQRVLDALAGLEGINRVTALNDAYHRTGQHPAGNAVDLTIKDPTQSAAMAAAIQARLAAAGINAKVLNEYTNPSANATGGHIHVGVQPPSGPPTGATASASISNITNSSSRAGDSNSTASTHIGTMIVNVPGGDADSVVGGISASLQRNNLAAPANFGQQ